MYTNVRLYVASHFLLQDGHSIITKRWTEYIAHAGVCVYRWYYVCTSVRMYLLLDWSTITTEATSQDPTGSPSNWNDEGSPLLLLLRLLPHCRHRCQCCWSGALHLCDVRLRVHNGHSNILNYTHSADPQTMCRIIYDHINWIRRPSLFLLWCF